MVLINNVHVVPGLTGWLLIDFNNNVRKLVNINPLMEGVLAKLKEPTFFGKVFVDRELQTISWPGELDLDPDTLYEKGIEIETIKNVVQAVKYNKDFSDFIDENIG